MNEYYMMRDSNYKIALRNLLNRIMLPEDRYNLITYKVPESYSSLIVPRSFHYPLLKNNRFTLYRSIIISENQREEIWYNGNGVIFYCKTGEIYEFFGESLSEIYRLEKLIKRATLSQVVITRDKEIKVKKMLDSFQNNLKKILQKLPEVTGLSQSDIYKVIQEARLMGNRSCCYASAVAYILLHEGKNFTICISSTSKHPDLVYFNDADSMFVETGGIKYFHDVRLKDYYGHYKQVNQDEVIELLSFREKMILNEARRTELVQKSEHDPRIERRKNYVKRRYNIKSVDDMYLVNFGDLKCVVEVGDYEITLFVNKFVKSLKVYKDLLGKDIKFNYDFLRSVVPKIIDASDLKVHCSCPDFKYRFAYWASKKKYKASYLELRPAKITNPDDSLGSACKHVLALLANKEWLRNLTPKIREVIEKNPKLVPK